jgi:hypothetical protein
LIYNFYIIGRITLGQKTIGRIDQDTRKTHIIDLLGRIALGSKKIGTTGQDSRKVCIIDIIGRIALGSKEMVYLFRTQGKIV